MYLCRRLQFSFEILQSRNVNFVQPTIRFVCHSTTTITIINMHNGLHTHLCMWTVFSAALQLCNRAICACVRKLSHAYASSHYPIDAANKLHFPLTYSRCSTHTHIHTFNCKNVCIFH